MKITELVLLEVSGDFPPDELQSQERLVNPLDVYPEFAARPHAPQRPDPAQKIAHTQVYLEVRTDEDVSGLFGPVDSHQLPVLRHEIRDFVVGRDPLATEKVWDLLLRRNRHAHSGYYMMAVSALDCALWDLRGKALGQPVYRLLGGPVREEVPAYASMLGFSLDPEALAERAREYRTMGYPAQKWFFRYGPEAGADGIARNVALVRNLREAVGDEYPLMFDAFHSWDLPYALDIAARIAKYHPAWLEEPVRVDRTEAFRTIREQTGVRVATGEHLYTRWQVKQLLDARAVDVIQADPDWCGGISELVKITTLCSAHEVPVCAHGHSLHAALHVAAACPPSAFPYVEFLILHQRSKQRFMKGYLQPENGRLAPPDRPGLGIELDPGKVQNQKELA
jgi:L-rhamnonate dehydratase